jgi:hypothetical protein
MTDEHKPTPKELIEADRAQRLAVCQSAIAAALEEHRYWAAEWRENPLATVTADGFEPLAGMWALLRELKAMEEVTLEGLDERLSAIERLVYQTRLVGL